MEATVERSDSQKSQSNGPRVSFNRDVHVKRIGSRPNELLGNINNGNNGGGGQQLSQLVTATILASGQQQQQQQPITTRELPSDLSEESILKEVAFVLKQAESVKCTAEGGDDIIGGRLNEKKRVRIDANTSDTKFNSLPTIKKKSKQSKSLSRSVSDASAKKIKKPSIFSIFGRKSDTNLDRIDSKENLNSNPNTGKPVTRSKSDVGSGVDNSQTPSTKERKLLRKRNNSENEDNTSSTTLKKKIPLTPIIENQPSEEYFTKKQQQQQQQKQSIEKKSIDTTDTIDKIDAIPIVVASIGGNNKINDTTSSPASSSGILKSGNIGYTNDNELDLIPSKPIADSLRQTITTFSNSKHSKSLEDMHCSQLPQQKPPLTKGLQVNGMVKRLSMERFSPPPQIHGPAFSYTRPANDQIIYAQVVCGQDNSNGHTNGDGGGGGGGPTGITGLQNNNGIKIKQTIHSTTFINSNPQHHRNDYHRDEYNNNGHLNINQDDDDDDGFDTVDHRKVVAPPRRKDIILIKNTSDEDEGVGLDIKKGRTTEETEFIPIKDSHYNTTPYYYNGNRQMSEEPPIIPVIRDISPVRIQLEPIHDSGRGRADGMDARKDANELNDLRNRRQTLESRIHLRKIGGSRELLNEIEQERNKAYKSNKVHNSGNKRGIDSDENDADDYDDEDDYDFDIGNANDLLLNEQVRSNRRGEYADEMAAHKHKLIDTKFHHIGSQEILNKYSADRSHIDIISPKPKVTTSKSKAILEQQHFKSKYNTPTDDDDDDEDDEEEDDDDDIINGKPHRDPYKYNHRHQQHPHHHNQQHHHHHRSPINNQQREIDLGYIDDQKNQQTIQQQHFIEPDTQYFQNKYRQEYEPKSLDSQYSDYINGSSPEQHTIKNHSNNHHIMHNNHHQHHHHHHHNQQQQQQPQRFNMAAHRLNSGGSGTTSEQRAAAAGAGAGLYRGSPIPNASGSSQFNSLQRDKRQQRSFDKGDSGIENDYRKDSFNDEFISRWKRRNVDDDIQDTDLFLKRERQHTEDVHPTKKFLDYIYRERSIDDGSHFDPRLDKYPVGHRMLSDGGSGRRSGLPADVSTKINLTNKNEKHMGTLERVKKLFIGNRSTKKNKQSIQPPTTTTTSSSSIINNNVDIMKIRNEDEFKSKSKYINESSEDLRELKTPDISTRRRLSTPKSSPIPKRTSSQKSSVITKSGLSRPVNSQTPVITPAKQSWFKSLERLSRKKQIQPKKIESDDDTSTLKSNKIITKKTTATVFRNPMPIINDSVLSKAPIPHAQQQQSQQHSTPQNIGSNKHQTTKNLRFFGDTDLESNASISKATSMMVINNNNNNNKQRKPLLLSTGTTLSTNGYQKNHQLERQNKKYSHSAYDLDSMQDHNNHNQRNHRQPSSSPVDNSSKILHNTNNTSNHNNNNRYRSTSLQHLDNVNGNNEHHHSYNNNNNNERHLSRSQHLNDISESASDNETDHLTKTNNTINNRHNNNNNIINNDVSPIISANSKLKLRNHHLPERIMSSTTTTTTKTKTPVASPAPAPIKQNRTAKHTHTEEYDDYDDEIEILKNSGGRSQQLLQVRHPAPLPVLSIDNSSDRMIVTEDVRSKPPLGPPKPPRLVDRRRAVSRERDRIQDSSGTEGDSSQISQRSVVYLHATTVGAIPQPQILNIRGGNNSRSAQHSRTRSREELSTISKQSTKHQAPMMKSISRSVSVLAPWKPKHLHEGYEINYSQSQETAAKQPKKAPTKQASSTINNKLLQHDIKSNTLQNRRSNSNSKLQMRNTDDHHHHHHQTSIRNSSITSASTMPRSVHRNNKGSNNNNSTTIGMASTIGDSDHSTNRNVNNKMMLSSSTPKRETISSRYRASTSNGGGGEPGGGIEIQSDRMDMINGRRSSTTMNRGDSSDRSNSAIGMRTTTTTTTLVSPSSTTPRRRWND